LLSFAGRTVTWVQFLSKEFTTDQRFIIQELIPSKEDCRQQEEIKNLFDK
jgi:hypothetical protein